MANWYDHPQYFDMVFRDETAAEVEFFQQAFDKYGNGTFKRVLEPGCGSGRLLVAMAELGYDVTGLDLSQPMLNYASKRLKRLGLDGDMVLGDMTDFQFKRKFDAAFCTFNTFRHLMSDDAAIAHLRMVADHLRKGGLYILGFHIIPLDADPECTERWKASHGGTSVSATLKVMEFNRRKRYETLRVSIKATKRSGKVERIQSEFPLRIYTASQVKSLLKKVAKEFEICDLFDFDYEIDEPLYFDNDLTDTVFVLKKK